MKIFSSRVLNRLAVYCCDLMLIVIAWFSAYRLSFDLHPLSERFNTQALAALPFLMVLQFCLFWMVGLYRNTKKNSWQFVSILDLTRIFQAVCLGSIITLFLLVLIDKFVALPLPRAVPVIYFLLLFSLLSGSRLLFHWFKDYKNSQDPTNQEFLSMPIVSNDHLKDLLGCAPINLNKEFLSADLKGKIILVSGGGGLIGSELCHQIASTNPTELVIVDNNECNLYHLKNILQKKFPHLIFKYFLQDVTDRIGVQKIVAQCRPQVLFHTAAYQHTSVLESQVRTAVCNNVIATRILASAAIENKVEKFVFTSTDKGVHPKSVMGVTKRVSEILCQELNSSSTQFITVRFGNVIDSIDNVVSQFRSQLQEGGPLTLTHPEITRYFITKQEAAQLIIHSCVLGKGGEIFILNMGQPIQIRDLAERMIKLTGKTLDKDISIVYTGLRSGEKLHEELFYEYEKLFDTTHPKIWQANSETVLRNDLFNLLDDLEKGCLGFDEFELHSILKKIIPEYQPYQETMSSLLLKAAV